LRSLSKPYSSNLQNAQLKYKSFPDRIVQS
jgi:hypothetical protein